MSNEELEIPKVEISKDCWEEEKSPDKELQTVNLDNYLKEEDVSSEGDEAEEIVDNDVYINPKDEDFDLYLKYSEALRKMSCQLLFISNICHKNSQKSSQKSDQKKDENEDPSSLELKASSCSVQKLEACTDAIFEAAARAEFTKSDFYEIIDAIENGKALESDFFQKIQKIKETSIWACIGEKLEDNERIKNLTKFAKFLFNQTPRHFGGGYANAGKGELMFCVLNPEFKKPSKGDLCVPIKGNRELVELKAEGGVLSSEVSKAAFQKELLEITKELEITDKFDPTILRKETEFSKKEKYDQLLVAFNRDPKKIREFVCKWIEATGGKFKDYDKEAKKLILEDIVSETCDLHFDILKQAIVISFFEKLCETDKFNYLMMVNEEGKMEIFPAKKEEFYRLLENGIIKTSYEFTSRFLSVKLEFFYKS